MPHPITVTREHLDLSTLSSTIRAVLGGGGGGGRREGGGREEGRGQGGKKGGRGREEGWGREEDREKLQGPKLSLISLMEGES